VSAAGPTVPSLEKQNRPSDLTGSCPRLKNRLPAKISQRDDPVVSIAQNTVSARCGAIDLSVVGFALDIGSDETGVRTLDTCARTR